MNDHDTMMAKIAARSEERDGHLIWTGYSNSHKTPMISLSDRKESVRRYLWEHEHGRLDKSMVVHVTCDEPLCIRHLEAVSKSAQQSDRATGRGKVYKPHGNETLDEMIERLLDKSGDCWLWGGGFSQGRARLSYHGQDMTVARYLYEQAHGLKLRQRDRIETTCGEPRCVNPAHVVLQANVEREREHHVAAARQSKRKRKDINWLLKCAPMCGFRMIDNEWGGYRVERMNLT